MTSRAAGPSPSAPASAAVETPVRPIVDPLDGYGVAPIPTAMQLVGPGTTVRVVGAAPHAPRLDFDTEQMRLMKATIMPGSTDDELAFFAGVCKRTGLDPFAKQIHAVSRNVNDNGQWVKKWSFQVAIDGFRLIAERTGKYRGQTLPLFCGDDGQWREVWTSTAPPIAAKVGVMRSDFDAPLYAVARWSEYVQTKDEYVNNRKTGALVPTSMWAKMPTVMLSKVAEALALRKAFPQEMSGLYTDDEMAQAENTRSDAATSRAEQTTHAGDSAQGAQSAAAVDEDAALTGEYKGAKWSGSGPLFAYGPMQKIPVNAVYLEGEHRPVTGESGGMIDVSGQYVITDERLQEACAWAVEKIEAHDAGTKPLDDARLAYLHRVIVTHGAELGEREIDQRDAPRDGEG